MPEFLLRAGGLGDQRRAFDHAEILRRRELFNNLRTLTALTAFAPLTTLSLRQPPAGRKQPQTASGPQKNH
ncbi:hypothetical protein AW27_015875 [Streptomyces sp. PCS3-D2]|uniref:hypothetical protein n=1 Tax=Streptomyces sp. PCS3-D2 TaxID=1460244 RepID=UPI000451526A|nr:hypothetical protein [Streptomyces sp. PCS3-D2]WKV72881.1 hypothetical protein AW27_015875 [Streptomyces sp. PCS3-D2]